jgi:UDP-glucuronate decarboxylase
MNILITGGAGNIGSSLAEKLSEMASHITILDNLLTGLERKIPQKKNISFIKADVNSYEDISAVFYTNKFDYVFHFAAVVGVKRTLANPSMVLDDIMGFKNVLNLCKNTCVKRVFYSSSSEIYGEPFEIPQHEVTTPLNSRLPYAIVKNVGEAYFRSYHQEYGLDYTIFRFFNTYGPKQSEDFVLPKFVRAAMSGNDITIYGDGNQTRTFCYIDDNIDTCISIMKSGLFKNDVINIGSDIEISIINLAKMIKIIIPTSVRIKNLSPLNEGDMTRRCPDISNMRKILNRDLIPLDEGIRKLVKSYNEGGD